MLVLIFHYNFNTGSLKYIYDVIQCWKMSCNIHYTQFPTM